MAAALDRRDYSQAVRWLSEVPEHLRDEELYADTVKNRERIFELDRVIREATPLMKLDVLRPAVDELLPCEK